MKTKIAFGLIATLLGGCSASIPPEVEAQFSKTLDAKCMALFGSRAYQKRTKDVLTPNPVFVISVGKESGKNVMTCASSAANASSNFNRSGALLTCEEARENYMVEHPKSVLQPCEVFAEGYRIIYRTPEADALRDQMRSLANTSVSK